MMTAGGCGPKVPLSCAVDFFIVCKNEPARVTYKTGKFTKSDKTGKDASFDHILLDGDYTPFVRCNHQTCSKIGLSKQKELK